jgi:lipoic acid synthetase
VPAEKLKKPDWIRVKAATGNSRFYEIKDILRANNLVTVCEKPAARTSVNASARARPRS